MSKETNTIVPTPENIEPIKIQITKDNSPSVKLFCCGGFGRARLKDIVTEATIDLGSVVAIDTVERDLKDVPIETIVINGTGSGSGGKRESNQAKIRDHLKTMYTDDELKLGDINIIVASMGGGTGSNVAEELIKIIHSEDKVSILFTVSDTSSELLTANTYKAFFGLLDTVEDNDMYLPIKRYDNSVGQKAVNDKLKTDIAILYTVLSIDIERLDRNDKINVFKPCLTTTADSGKMARLAVALGDENISSVLSVLGEDTLDSVLYIVDTDDATINIDSRVITRGVDTEPVVIVMGHTVEQEFINTLEKTYDKFESKQPKEKLKVNRGRKIK